VTGRRGRRHKQLLHDIKERTGYWKLKEEALDCTLMGNSLSQKRWACHKTLRNAEDGPFSVFIIQMTGGLQNILGSHFIPGHIIYSTTKRQNEKTRLDPAVLHTVAEARPTNGRFITKPPTSLPRCRVSRSPWNCGNISGTAVRRVCTFLSTRC
jgi:hypothetical protein